MSLTKKYIKSKKVCKVTFSVPEQLANGSEFVSILGDFNNWDFNAAEMKKLKDGSFEKTFELQPGSAYEFRYMTNEGRWFNDEAADGYKYTEFGGTDNSVLDLSKIAVTTATKTAKTKTAKLTAKSSTAAKKTTVAKKATAAKKATTAPKKAVAKSTVQKTSGTVAKVTATKGKKDDLRKIEGIGPKIAEILAENKIDTFEVLAKTTVARLEKILSSAGSRFSIHKPASWPKQAGIAAKGNWAELKKLQDKLNGGK